MHGAILGHLRKSAECSIHCAASTGAPPARPGAAAAVVVSGGGDAGHHSWSSPALRLTQAATGLAEDACDPFALIGRGASPGHMARPAQRLHLSAAVSPRLCCNDRCNLQGRSCFPTRLRTFDELHAEALRPRVLTVRELFGRMLRQVKGVSGESSAVH